MYRLTRTTQIVFSRGLAPVINSRCASGTTETRPPAAQMPKMTDIGSRQLFEPHHDVLREAARKFINKEMVPNMLKWEEDGKVDKALWEKAGANGFLNASIPAEHGGIGGTFLDSAIFMEEMSYANCSAPAFGLHSEIVMPYISKYGNAEQREKYIVGGTSGKIVSAIAMTEPDAGSDLQGVRTFARKDGSDYILNGSKIYITNGWLADVVVVVAVTNREAKSAAHGISLFLVDEGTPGFRKAWLMKKIGMNASDTAALFFEDVRLPRSSLLGEENKGFYYLMNELPQERLVIAIHACANAEWAFEETRKYVAERKAFGKTLSKLQTIQHELAEIKTKIAVTRAFVDQCIELHCRGKLDHSMASMAKYWASELQVEISSRCLQLHGGAGYIYETPIARSFIDSRVQTIYGGSNEVMKELIARSIFSK